MTPQTDIVIAIRGTRRFPIEKDFENCIEALVANTSNYRLILVDDNSDEEGAAVVSRVASQFPTSVLIRTQRQNWFSKAHNKGLRLVKTPKAVALNADTLPQAGWLDEMYAVWEEVEQQGMKVGLVGSTHSIEEPRRYHLTQNPGYVTGHCLLMSMRAINEASESRGSMGWYFDEVHQEAIHIHSDKYLSYELNKLGYQTIMSFKSAVAHLGGRSWGHLLGECLSVRLEDLPD